MPCVMSKKKACAGYDNVTDRFGGFELTHSCPQGMWRCIGAILSIKGFINQLIYVGLV